MTVRSGRWFLCIVVAGILTAGASTFWYQKLNPREDTDRFSTQHVFINETADHRFDESIQVSIIASYDRTKVQNAVVITDRFASQSLSKAAADLFKQLNLGRATKGRAVLYLFSPKSKSLKIEVGYALEDVLPDVIVHGLERAAKSFTFVDRYQDFWAELINTLNIEIYDREQGTAAPLNEFDFSRMRFVSGGAGVLSNQYGVEPEQLEAEMKRLPPAEDEDTIDHSRFLADATVQTTLSRYLKSLGEGVGDERLPLLSLDSRSFRLRNPQTTYQLFRNWKMYQRAGLDRIIQLDSIAFAFFKKGYPALPLVFQLEDGLWKVNEPLSWALFQRFENSMNTHLKFPLQSASAPLQEYVRGTFTRPLNAGPTVAIDKLNRITRKADPFRFYYFKHYWLEKAVATFEQSPALLADRNSIRIAIDAYNNLGRVTPALELMSRLLRLEPRDRDLARAHDYFKTVYVFSGPNWQKTLE